MKQPIRGNTVSTPINISKKLDRVVPGSSLGTRTGVYVEQMGDDNKWRPTIHRADEGLTNGKASIPIRDYLSQNFHVGAATQNNHPINSNYLLDNLRLEMDNTDYRVNLIYTSPKHVDGTEEPEDHVLSTIDLPLESAVMGASYDTETRKLTLTLNNGNSVAVPIGDILNTVIEKEGISNLVQVVNTKEITVLDWISNEYVEGSEYHLDLQRADTNESISDVVLPIGDCVTNVGYDNDSKALMVGHKDGSGISVPLAELYDLNLKAAKAGNTYTVQLMDGDYELGEAIEIVASSGGTGDGGNIDLLGITGWLNGTELNIQLFKADPDDPANDTAIHWECIDLSGLAGEGGGGGAVAPSLNNLKLQMSQTGNVYTIRLMNGAAPLGDAIQITDNVGGGGESLENLEFNAGREGVAGGYTYKLHLRDKDDSSRKISATLPISDCVTGISFVNDGSYNLTYNKKDGSSASSVNLRSLRNGLAEKSALALASSTAGGKQTISLKHGEEALGSAIIDLPEDVTVSDNASANGKVAFKLGTGGAGKEFSYTVNNVQNATNAEYAIKSDKSKVHIDSTYAYKNIVRPYDISASDTLLEGQLYIYYKA